MFIMITDCHIILLNKFVLYVNILLFYLQDTKGSSACVNFANVSPHWYCTHNFRLVIYMYSNWDICYEMIVLLPFDNCYYGVLQLRTINDKDFIINSTIFKTTFLSKISQIFIKTKSFCVIQLNPCSDFAVQDIRLQAF